MAILDEFLFYNSEKRPNKFTDHHCPRHVYTQSINYTCLNPRWRQCMIMLRIKVLTTQPDTPLVKYEPARKVALQQLSSHYPCLDQHRHLRVCSTVVHLHHPTEFSQTPIHLNPVSRPWPISVRYSRLCWAYAPWATAEAGLFKVGQQVWSVCQQRGTASVGRENEQNYAVR